MAYNVKFMKNKYPNDIMIEIKKFKKFIND